MVKVDMERLARLTDLPDAQSASRRWAEVLDKLRSIFQRTLTLSDLSDDECSVAISAWLCIESFPKMPRVSPLSHHTTPLTLPAYPPAYGIA